LAAGAHRLCLWVMEHTPSISRNKKAPPLMRGAFQPGNGIPYFAAISRVSIVTVFADSSVLPVTFTV